MTFEASLGNAIDAWRLRAGPPFASAYSSVCAVELADGTRAVLRAALPDREFCASVEFLRLAGGRDYPALLACDEDKGVALVERIEPGMPLSALSATDDDEATRILAAAIASASLPVPMVSVFPTLTDWADGFARHRARYDAAPNPLPEKLVDAGEAVYRALIADAATEKLLHGDFHHDNLLLDQRGVPRWRPIDPQGVIGDPVHETAAMLRNPPEREVTAELLDRRIAILAEVTGFDRDRIKAWGFAQTVLSVIWSLEDGGEFPAGDLRVAELLRP